MTDTDNLSRRRFLQGTGAAATAAALAGCTGGDGDSDGTTEAPTTTESTGGGGDTQETTEQQQIDTSKIVRSASASTMDTLDPIKATDTTSGGMIQNIFDALTNYPNGQTNVKNLLAKSMESSNGGKTLTFNLKQGVKYNNGEEVTAQDFVYSFERLAASKNSRRSTFLLDTLGVKHETTTTTNSDGEETEVYKPGTIDVQAVDDYTLEINLSQAFYAATSMLAYTSFSAIPEGLLGDIEGYDGRMDYQEFATTNPVGAGPYTLDTWEQATERRLAARDDYHGGEIRNAGTYTRVFNETNPAYTYATVNVNADFPYIPSGQFDPSLRSFEGTDDRGRRYGTYGPMEENDLTADYYEAPSPSVFYLAFNCKNVAKPIRQAVAYVTDQEVVSNQLLSSPVIPAYHFTPPGLFPGGPDNYNQQAQDYKYKVEGSGIPEAKQVMEDAGYGSNNRYKLTFDMPSATASSWGQDLYTLLRDKLTQAYIDLELNSADWNTFLNSLRNGNAEMYYLGWLADYPGLDNFLQLAYPPMTDTSSDKFFGYINWTEENGDYADEAKAGWQTIQNNYASGEANREARGEGGLQMEKAIEQDAVYIPLFHNIEQGMSYQWVDKPRFGAMGPSRQKELHTGIGDRGDHEP
ncbi:MAG: ABC transporter substrate-binding protein [Halobacterium sp.]